MVATWWWLSSYVRRLTLWLSDLRFISDILRTLADSLFSPTISQNFPIRAGNYSSRSGTAPLSRLAQQGQKIELELEQELEIEKEL